MPEKVLSIRGLRRSFGSAHDVQVLEDLNLDLHRGERVAVMGASGSGKTTLLHLAAGMDTPDTGEVLIDGKTLSTLREPERSRFRARYIGLVFQDFNLIDSLTVRENIELPLWLNGLTGETDRIRALTDELGISALLERLPEKLSGGEKQRVAIARAFVTSPAVLFADEPTGNLDTRTGERVIDTLFEMNRDRATTLVLVTHDEQLAARCGRRLELDAGRLVTDRRHA